MKQTIYVWKYEKDGKIFKSRCYYQSAFDAFLGAKKNRHVYRRDVSVDDYEIISYELNGVV